MTKDAPVETVLDLILRRPLMLRSRRSQWRNGLAPMVSMTRVVSMMELPMMVIRRRERRCDSICTCCCMV
jgi:hypothetical protein